MNQIIRAKFLKTSELYLKISEHDANTSDMQDVVALAFLEHKMSNRFLHHSKSVLLDMLS